MPGKAISKAPPTRRSSERGFSMAELMAVVGLITVASGIGLATLMPYNSQYKVKGAAFLVAADLQRTRMDAVRTRLCHFFDRTSTTQYRIVRDNPAAQNCTLGADDTVLRTVNLSNQFSGVTFSQGSSDIDPFGLSISGPAPTSLRFEPRGLVMSTW